MTLATVQVILSLLFLIATAIHVVRLHHAGAVLLDLGWTQQALLCAGLALVGLGFAVFSLLAPAENSAGRISSVCYGCSLALFWAVVSLSRLEARHGGLCIGLHVIDYKDIISYAVADLRGTVQFHWLGGKTLTVGLPLPVEKREQLVHILDEQATVPSSAPPLYA